MSGSAAIVVNVWPVIPFLRIEYRGILAFLIDGIFKRLADRLVAHSVTGMIHEKFTHGHGDPASAFEGNVH